MPYAPWSSVSCLAVADSINANTHVFSKMTDTLVATPECERLFRSLTSSPLALAIDGTIAVGKTTLGQLFYKLALQCGVDAHFLSEKRHTPILDVYVHDQKRYAFPFQILMMEDALNRQEMAALLKQRGIFALLERPVFGNHVFARVNLECGYIEQRDYDEFYAKLVPLEGEDEGLDAVLWLHVDLEETMKRMGLRGELCEQDYANSYLGKLHDAYFCAMLTALLKGRSLLPVPWTESMPTETLLAHLCEWRQGLLERAHVTWTDDERCTSDAVTVSVDWQLYRSGNRRQKTAMQREIVALLFKRTKLRFCSGDSKCAPFSMQ
jgi:deoxyadenosine/deoxycytidine kinase